jgi:ribosomal protein S27AE
VDNDVTYYATEKDLLKTSKPHLNENDCPNCGERQLTGNASALYGRIKIYERAETAKREKKKFLGTKWRYYEMKVEKGQHVKCPKCNWQLKHGADGIERSSGISRTA